MLEFFLRSSQRRESTSIDAGIVDEYINFAKFLSVLGEILGMRASMVNTFHSCCSIVSTKLSFLINITVAGHMREFVKYLFISDKAVS